MIVAEVLKFLIENSPGRTAVELASAMFGASHPNAPSPTIRRFRTGILARYLCSMLRAGSTIIIVGDPDRPKCLQFEWSP